MRDLYMLRYPLPYLTGGAAVLEGPGDDIPAEIRVVCVHKTL